MPDVTFFGRHYYDNGFIRRYSNRQLVGMIGLALIGALAGYLLLGMADVCHFPPAVANFIHW